VGRGNVAPAPEYTPANDGTTCRVKKIATARVADASTAGYIIAETSLFLRAPIFLSNAMYLLNSLAVSPVPSPAAIAATYSAGKISGCLFMAHDSGSPALTPAAMPSSASLKYPCPVEALSASRLSTTERPELNRAENP
jgi:hypothetical protein